MSKNSLLDAREKALKEKESQLQDKYKQFEDRMTKQQQAFDQDKRSFEVKSIEINRELEAKTRALDDAKNQIERFKKVNK